MFYVSPEGNAVAEFPDEMVEDARAVLAALLARREAGEFVDQHEIDEAKSLADWTEAPPDRIAAHHVAMARSTWFAGAPDPVDAEAYTAWTQARALALAAVTEAELPYAKSTVLRDLANLRWRREVAGTLAEGMAIPTDATAQSKFAGAVMAAMLDPAYVVTWKLAYGNFVTLGHDQIVAIAQAVRAHVQGCFDHEATLSAQVEAAATPAALSAIDIEAGWPA
ncbi:MAG: DUF4376 domain-containing protein [Rhodoblastus sp.]